MKMANRMQLRLWGKLNRLIRAFRVIETPCRIDGGDQLISSDLARVQESQDLDLHFMEFIVLSGASREAPSTACHPDELKVIIDIHIYSISMLVNIY